uniref:60S ribosomal export protein NMD3 n=1 Tax=Piliocolobus tephrosceles TaxID=591936 RepID=A0A8C9GTZ7_9PRIM
MYPNYNLFVHDYKKVEEHYTNKQNTKKKNIEDDMENNKIEFVHKLISNEHYVNYDNRDEINYDFMSFKNSTNMLDNNIKKQYNIDNSSPKKLNHLIKEENTDVKESIKNYNSSTFVGFLNTIKENKKIENKSNKLQVISSAKLNIDNEKSNEKTVDTLINNSTCDVMIKDNPNTHQAIINTNENHIIFPNVYYKKKQSNDEVENSKEQLRTMFCILCGDSIFVNLSKMCNNCLLQNVENNSANMNKDTYLIYYCRECKRYLHNKWVHCELESKELLALCLKKVNKLKKLKILDAKFLYTEPHSKRIKIHLTVQEELINNFISEMEIILHYVIKYT